MALIVGTIFAAVIGAGVVQGSIRADRGEPACKLGVIAFAGSISGLWAGHRLMAGGAVTGAAVVRVCVLRACIFAGALAGGVVLREPLRWQVLVGGIVILCGIAITSWGART